MPLILLGVKECCEILNCTADQFWSIRQKETFPPPAARLASGDVWYSRDINRYARRGRSTTRQQQPVAAVAA